MKVGEQGWDVITVLSDVIRRWIDRNIFSCIHFFRIGEKEMEEKRWNENRKNVRLFQKLNDAPLR